MKIILILSFFFDFFDSFGQNKRLGKIQLLKVINSTISQKPNPKNNNSCEDGLCGEWWSNNKNGKFYKTDTVKLYNYSNFYQIDSSYCTFKIWEFESNNNFSQSGAEMCTEPPLRTFETNIAFGGKKSKRIIPNKFQIVQKDSLVFIVTLVGKSMFEKYQVISIDQNKSIGQNAFILTLVRKRVK